MLIEKKIIFIFGFHHSGTTILRTILGHIDNINMSLEEKDPFECKDILLGDDKKFYVIKNPEIKNDYFYEKYKDIYKIFLIRNPLCVISSCNKRHINKMQNKQYIEHNITNYLEMVKKYCEFKTSNLFHIRYEDMFTDSYESIKNILNKISVNFNNTIFNNTLYSNVSHKHQDSKDIPITRPSDTDHKKLRLYQVNQTFINNNDYNSLYLKKEQLISILENKYIKQLYPEIEEICKSYKINII